MSAPPIPAEPEVYPPFASPLQVQDHNYNRDWDVNGHKTVGDRLMEIRQGVPGTRVTTPYNPPLPLICDIDQDIYHTLYLIRERTCTIVEDGTSTFFTTIHAPIPNQRCVAPERHISSVCGGTLYLYRKRDCPLSNTFPAPITWRGMEFPNVVVCVQAMKAYHFRDFTALEKIRQAESVTEARQLTLTIDGYRQDLWDQFSIYYMTVAMLGKFMQNRHLQPYVTQTHEDAIFASLTH